MIPRLAGAVAAALGVTAATADPDPADWAAVEAEARGQTVFWHAWGGSAATNDFIAWVGGRVLDAYGVTLEHVRLSDTAEAVSRVLGEKSAGITEDGAVDLIWINGANFAAMKEADLLWGPFADDLPNASLVEDAPYITSDFGEPVEGLESPWAAAQLVFMYDSDDAAPVSSTRALGEWASRNPGRFTFPQPPDFLGTTFLKQALVALTDDPGALAAPVDEADFDAVTAPLWSWLDDLTPNLWRQGRAYPQSGPAQFALISDDEIDIAPSLSPGEASAAIAAFKLPESVRTFVPDEGTIGNASFVAIPFNASAKAGAMVVANVLLSPEAQLRAQNPEILGYGTVLDLDRVPADIAAAFADLPLGPATLGPDELGDILPEPHASWAPAIEAEWTRRYGSGR